MESSHLLSIQAALYSAVCKVRSLSRGVTKFFWSSVVTLSSELYSRELRLGGWSKIGFPGVIVVEGGEM